MPKGHNRKSTWMRLGELDWEEQRDLQSVSLPASMTGMVPREHLLDLGAGIKQLMGEREIRKERYVGSTGDGGGEREAAAGVLLLTGEKTGRIDLDE